MTLRPSFPDEPLGIVAGGGILPRLVAERASEAGWRPLLIAVGDGLSGASGTFEQRSFTWGRVADTIPFLRKRGACRLVFCGTISVRPDFRALVPSIRTLAMMPEIFRIMRGGDDSVLRAAARTFENKGFQVLAVQEIIPELLMPSGALTRREPNREERAALDRAFEAARRLGELDIGQAVVASSERVIALEGIEGTKEVLERVAALRRRGRIAARERCVLVKSVKPKQDLRFDLPSIGLSTIEEAAAAGLSGIGLSAGHALVLGYDDVVRACEAAGIFLIGREMQEDSSSQ